MFAPFEFTIGPLKFKGYFCRRYFSLIVTHG